MEILIVDGANVVGSRPDGWWRDRAAAARRLHDELSSADLSPYEVVLVLEGAAKRGCEEGREGRVRTLHAPGSGDDAIVEAVATYVGAEGVRSVVVVTADRLLRSRVDAAGATSRGPSWLLAQL